jgi:hypothetical protein
MRNIASRVDVAATPATFEPLLGAATRISWDSLNTLWADVEADARAKTSRG